MDIYLTKLPTRWLLIKAVLKSAAKTENATTAVGKLQFSASPGVDFSNFPNESQVQKNSAFIGRCISNGTTRVSIINKGET